jgi:hypothetical protein
MSAESFDSWCIKTHVLTLHPDREYIKKKFGEKVADSRAEALAAWNYRQKEINELEKKIDSLSGELTTAIGFLQLANQKANLSNINHNEYMNLLDFVNSIILKG